MRVLVVAAVVLGAARAGAEPMPSGAIGVVSGAVAGSGRYNKLIGYGDLFDSGRIPFIGIQASWQPTVTERRIGWTIRWATLFGTLYGGDAERVEQPLHTVQMDLTIGIRVRPWTTPTRYLTLRAGGELFRSNEPIPMSVGEDNLAEGDRAFVGGIASVGIDQYVGGFLFNIDVQYGLISPGSPTELALLIGFAKTGP